jgi:hypothetical protein
MGIIVREWQCADCGTRGETMGPLEEVVCPTCNAQEVERAFFTAPGLKSPKTTTADNALKGLAADYGLTDISNKDGGPVKRPPTGEHAPQFTAGNPQVMAAIQKLGSNADGFSSVLPALQRTGRPHQWNKARERR